jgi:uncharacterized protein (DUF58 family)
MRKLYVTKAGYWYVVLTIAMGVVALVTANNVLYLMECLLLGGLILSGVISERSISSIDVEWVRKQAVAGEKTRDFVEIDNPTRFAFFCLEIGEWRDGEFEPFAFVTKIDARSKTRVAVERTFEKRGLHAWDGIGIATSAPFGFAQKVLVLREPGRRLVWPAQRPLSGQERRESARAGSGVADAEVRAYGPDDDIRSIIWKLSAKGLDPVARKSRVETPQARLTLRLAAASPGAFENEVGTVANSIYRAEELPGADVRLRVLGSKDKKTFVGRVPALNYLATAQPEDRP